MSCLFQVIAHHPLQSISFASGGDTVSQFSIKLLEWTFLLPEHILISFKLKKWLIFNYWYFDFFFFLNWISKPICYRTHLIMLHMCPKTRWIREVCFTLGIWEWAHAHILLLGEQLYFGVQRTCIWIFCLHHIAVELSLMSHFYYWL